MQRISEITKRDIYDLFRDGLEIVDFWETELVRYDYFGRMEELEFLGRLYDLKNMDSIDSRFSNAYEDIWQHTVNNDDYPYCWVFEEERFQLKNGSDETYLKFLCEIFHPAVRDEKGHWKDFFAETNKLLQNDGYELYPSEKISGREAYGWRIFSLEENNLFIPFSQRNAKAIKNKTLVLTISRNARNQIYQFLKKHDVTFRETDETGWNYDVTISEKVFIDIQQFYVPKCFNSKNQYIETHDLKEFVCNSSPYCILDAIEFFEKYCYGNEFETQINMLFKLNSLNFKLDNGRIVSVLVTRLKSSDLSLIQEVGLKELLQEAVQYYDRANYMIAVEKLWDAFERLKTYYSPSLDKKKSVAKLIKDMSGNEKAYEELFEKEFCCLTTIGNNFRIRHHETTRTDIEDDRHYDYFYKRCLSLISIAVQYIK